MKIFNYKNISEKKLAELFQRPAAGGKNISGLVEPILDDVKKNGDNAILKYAKKFDGLLGNEILVSKDELEHAAKKISGELKSAIDVAAKNIEKFHKKQKPKSYSIETMPGVKCSRSFLPIENVGLYVPGGSAVLISTMLMLGIPAKIAGCKRIIVSSPLKEKEINPALAYAARVCGISEFYKVGGAHSIAMMSYGTKSVKKVDKIFGPGNQYVTTAKSLVSIDPKGCAIDMPSGPSEALVIADKYANASFVAADLLSQAEHGADSQVILLTTNEKFAAQVSDELEKQLQTLPRKKIAEKSLDSSFTLIVPTTELAIELSNGYAPEHLIINTSEPEKLISKIVNAGSVFLGAYSPESVGDYASGTNHSLPTYGYAKSFGGVSVESFMKPVTFQQLTKKGLGKISRTVINLAEAEKLDAHASAVKVRLKS